MCPILSLERHTWYHAPEGRGSSGEAPAGATALSSKHSSTRWWERRPVILTGLPVEDDTFPGELISWLEPGVTHSWLVSGGRNRYIKSKQFLSRLRTACGARGKGLRGAAITAVETTF